MLRLAISDSTKDSVNFFEPNAITSPAPATQVARSGATTIAVRTIFMPGPSPFEHERSRSQIFRLGTRRIQQKDLAAQSAPHSAAQPNRQAVRLRRDRG